MGWRLAEEVARARPKRPGPEWWTLMDIAQDARDETRQSMCGHEYLMQRGKCSKATLYRRLDALREAKLITVVRHSAPGVRAVYEVAPLDSTGLTEAETCTGLTEAETRSEPTGLKNRSNRSQKAFETGLSVSETHPVTTTPSLTPSVGASAPTAQTLLGSFIDWDRANGGTLTRRTIGQLAKQITALLAEGISDKYIRIGLAAWRAKEQHPSTLDSFVNAAMNGKPARPPPRQSTGDRAIAEAAVLKAQLLNKQELA